MKKLFVVCSLIFSLYACGFKPMYSNDLMIKTKEVWVAPISGTNGIDLRNSLRAQLGDNDDEASAQYSLIIDLQDSNQTFKGLQKTGDATWQEISIKAKYLLKENTSGKVLLNGSETAAESYTFVTDLVSAQSSQKNAEQNTIRLLADKISMRVSAMVAK